MQNGLKYRTNQNSTWRQDGMCLTEQDARQVVADYRAHYSPARCRWLLKQALRDNPFGDCREVFQQSLDNPTT